MGRRLEGACWGAAAVVLWGCCAVQATLVLEQGLSCNHQQYQQEKVCCQKCPPGQRMVLECSVVTGDTLCEPCEGQHFQAGWTKEKYCTPHRECSENAGLVVHTPGTALRDAECRCRNGTHCSSHECHTCRRNTLCGPGQGVQQEATHEHDTVCVDCPEGSFSTVSSATAPCQPWSSCKDQNLVQKKKGTSVLDAVCDFPPPSPSPPSSRYPERTHMLVLLPLAALLLLGGLFVLWSWRRHRDLQKPLEHNQDNHPFEGQQPAEVDMEDFEDCPALPVQETLPGGQSVAQEDGKESRLAVQEQV